METKGGGILIGRVKQRKTDENNQVGKARQGGQGGFALCLSHLREFKEEKWTGGEK